MKNKLGYTVLLLFIASVAGLVFYTKPFTEMSTDVANGRIQYNKNCLSCHGAEGYGDGILAATLDKRPTNINEKFKTTWRPDNRLTRRILVGKPKSGMPAFNTVMSEKDAEDVLAYVRTLK